MRRWRATALTTVLAALLVFPGCGSPASGGGPGASGPSDPDTAVSDDGNTSDMTADTGKKGKAELREPDPNVVNPIPVDWDKAKGKGRKITVFYYSGVKECYGLHHVDVKETEKKVTISIFDGNNPDAEVCIELAQRVRTIVKLAHPLGDRTLVDGAE
jgi:hypothetical protein